MCRAEQELSKKFGEIPQINNNNNILNSYSLHLFAFDRSCFGMLIFRLVNF